MWDPHNGVLVVKKKDILTRATTWTTLEDIIKVSELSRSQEDKYGLTPLICGSYGSQNKREWEWDGGCQELRRGAGVRWGQSSGLGR